jgi:predicted O-methyltransferase YrrM
MPPLAAGLIVFITSAAVLVLEILAIRLLAPYVGVTLETYTAIIGTVLAGIAFGTWRGGRLADRIDPYRLLGPMVLLGGVLALTTVPVVTLLGAGLAATGGGPVAIVLLAFAGFFAPAAVLSAVNPTVVKVQLADLAVTGQVVGRLSALSTAGAILGTFLTGFVLVAAWPTRPIIIALGAALVAGGVGLWLWLAPKGTASPATLGVAALLIGAVTFATGSPCDYESPYYCARVVEDPDRETGRVLVLDRLRHSYVDLADPTHLGFEYMRVFGDVLAGVAADGAALDVLHIGGGGFTMPRYLRAAHPGSTSVVLEIDPRLVEIAEAELDLQRAEDLIVRHGDARLSIRDQPADAFDVVIGDAFGGLAVPWHLTTTEMLDDVRRVLRPGGLYVLNIIDYPPLRFARAKAATMDAAFAHAAIIAEPARLEGRAGGNFVLLGSDRPLPTVPGRTLATGPDHARFAGAAAVLTDDHAPVDQLLTPQPLTGAH